LDRPPARPGWLHETKHNGFRALAWKQGERVTVWSRRGAEFTDRFSNHVAVALAGATRGVELGPLDLDHHRQVSGSFEQQG
jgi:ATP-dependent DNA ligase